MDWQKERDALINETMALVARVNATKPEAAPQPPALPTKPSEVEADREHARLVPIQWETSEREHITRRVETFKAHQERVRREREDYCVRTMHRARETAKGRPRDKA